MRATSTPTGALTSAALTAAATAESQLRGDSPVASVMRTTEAGEGRDDFLRRTGIGVRGAARFRCRRRTLVAIRSRLFRLHRWQRGELEQLVDRVRDALVEHA